MVIMMVTGDNFMMMVMMLLNDSAYGDSEFKLCKDINSSHIYVIHSKQACKLQATLVRNYESLTHLLTGVRCRATSVAKNPARLSSFQSSGVLWDRTASE